MALQIPKAILTATQSKKAKPKLHQKTEPARLLAAMQKTAFSLFAFFLYLFPLVGLQAEEGSLKNRFSYNGDMLYRGYYLWRDIDMPNTQLETANTPKVEQSYRDYYICQLLPAQCNSLNRTKTRDSEDFSTLRLRMNLALRPAPYADVLYGIEVGHLTFGRDSASKTGPGTGGQGSGRVNIETREILLRLHNRERSLNGDLGVFTFSTPSGIVFASSGAGGRLHLDVESLRSSLEAIYVHAVDHSQIDGDSNGFSDSNFSGIRMGILQWKYSAPRYFKSKLYGVYRVDNDPSTSDPTESNQELSHLGWAGLYLDFQWKRFGLVLHGIGNWGSFSRPLASDPKIAKILSNPQDPLNPYFTEAVKPPVRRKYRVNAGAAQAAFRIEATDSLTLEFLGAGASGRIPQDREPDGSSVDFRPDQFRTAGSSFSYTEIAIDDSGGYSIFKAGRLTGVVARGVRLNWQITPKLAWDLAWFDLNAYRVPVIDGNTKYTRFLDVIHLTGDLGQEWNTHLNWKVFDGFTVTSKLAWFDADVAYKILNDIEYGDDIYEFAIFLKQKF